MVNNSSELNPATDYGNIFTENEILLIKVGYVIMSSLGIFFNGIVCYLILRFRHLRIIVNILILNLAVSDIVACISIYPFVFVDVSKTNLRGTSANLVCGLTEGVSLFFIVATVSLLTLSVLSISRYIVISHPLKLNWRLKKGNLKYIFSLIWITSAALLIPSSVSFEFDKTKKFCVRSWAPGIHKIVYFLFTGVLGFFIPISSLTFTYITSVRILWFKQSARQARLSGSSMPHGNLRVKKRVSILLGMLIVVYLLCWMPFAIYWLKSAGMGQYDDSMANEIEGVRNTRITIIIALSNTVFNPIVYAFTNVHLRTAFCSCLKRKKLNVLAQRGNMSGGLTLISYARRYTFETKDIKREIAFISINRPREMTI